MAFAAAWVLADGAPRAASAAEGCGSGGTTTKTGAGAYEIRFCGSAVATLRIRAQTYIFRDGACFDADGRGTLLYAGTEVIHDGEIANILDGHGPFFSLGLAKPLAGVAAYEGGHLLLVGSGSSGLTPVKVSGSNAAGTFSGRSRDPGKSVSSGAQIAFAGTWTCGGQVHSWQDFVANVNRPINEG